MTVISSTKPNFIQAQNYSIKRSNTFTAMGWIKDPLYDLEVNPLIMLAVSDFDDNVEGVDSSIKVELLKDGRDFRLSFSNSRSKLVRKTVGVSLDDGQWHFLAYSCRGDGSMSYVVDGKILAAEDGVGEDGILYSVAWSRAGKQGGGRVWSPYLYKASQAISVYHWRFGTDLILDLGWISEIMEKDRQRLLLNV